MAIFWTIKITMKTSMGTTRTGSEGLADMCVNSPPRETSLRPMLEQVLVSEGGTERRGKDPVYLQKDAQIDGVEGQRDTAKDAESTAQGATGETRQAVSRKGAKYRSRNTGLGPQGKRWHLVITSPSHIQGHTAGDRWH